MNTTMLVEYPTPMPSSVVPHYAVRKDEQSFTLALQEVVRHLPDAISQYCFADLVLSSCEWSPTPNLIRYYSVPKAVTIFCAHGDWWGKVLSNTSCCLTAQNDLIQLLFPNFRVQKVPIRCLANFGSRVVVCRLLWNIIAVRQARSNLWLVGSRLLSDATFSSCKAPHTPPSAF